MAGARSMRSGSGPVCRMELVLACIGICSIASCPRAAPLATCSGRRGANGNHASVSGPGRAIARSVCGCIQPMSSITTVIAGRPSDGGGGIALRRPGPFRRHHWRRRWMVEAGRGHQREVGHRSFERLRRLRLQPGMDRAEANNGRGAQSGNDEAARRGHADCLRFEFVGIQAKRLGELYRNVQLRRQ